MCREMEQIYSEGIESKMMSKEENDEAAKKIRTAEEARELFDRLSGLKEINLDVACIICEIEDSRLYTDRGFDSFEDFVKAYFNKGTTQMKIYRRVCEVFGERSENGSYFIPNKEHIAKYGINALNEIQKLMSCKGVSLAELERDNIVSPYMTVCELKQAVKRAKRRPEKQDSIKNALNTIYLHCLDDNITDKAFRLECKETLKKYELYFKVFGGKNEV